MLKFRLTFIKIREYWTTSWKKQWNIENINVKMRNSLTKFGWIFECWAVQKRVNFVDLAESFPKMIYLQTLALIQPRTSPVKFASILPWRRAYSGRRFHPTQPRSADAPLVAVADEHVHAVSLQDAADLSGGGNSHHPYPSEAFCPLLSTAELHCLFVGSCSVTIWIFHST